MFHKRRRPVLWPPSCSNADEVLNPLGGPGDTWPPGAPLSFPGPQRGSAGFRSNFLGAKRLCDCLGDSVCSTRGPKPRPAEPQGPVLPAGGGQEGADRKDFSGPRPPVCTTGGRGQPPARTCGATSGTLRQASQEPGQQRPAVSMPGQAAPQALPGSSFPEAWEEGECPCRSQQAGACPALQATSVAGPCPALGWLGMQVW